MRIGKTSREGLRGRVMMLAIGMLAWMAGPVWAGISGPGQSGIQAQNLETDQSAHITAEFYDYSGRLAHRITRRDVPPGGFANFYLPAITELKNGAYSMVLRAELADDSGAAARIGAISRTDWPDSGGAVMYADVPPAEEVYVPLIVHQPGRQVSLVSIQNTDVKASNAVQVDLFAAGADVAAVSAQLQLPPAGAALLDLGKDARFTALPTDFVGAMRISGDRPVAVMSIIDLENSDRAVSAFEAVPVDRAGAKLYAPLFRSDYFGTTGISVVNPGADAVQVRVTYRGTESPQNRCAGQEIVHAGGRAAAIPAGSSAVFYQGGATDEAGAPGLPSGCFGSALIEVLGEGRVMAIVNDFALGTDGRPRTAAAYNAVPAEAGARRVSAPLVRHAHTAFRYSTGLQVMNLGDAPARVKLQVFDESNHRVPGGSDREVSIPPAASHSWYMPAVSGISSGMYGSAMIEGDQPVAVIVADASETGAVDLVSYNGIPADPAGGFARLDSRRAESGLGLPEQDPGSASRYLPGLAPILR